MDIKQFDVKAAVEKGHTFTLLYPEFDPEGRGGEETDVKIEVVGIGSKVFDDAYGAIEAYQNKCYSKNKPTDAAHMRKLHVDLGVACTQSWTGWKTDGKEFPFSKANAEALYTENAWIAGQVSDAIVNIKAMLEKK